MSYLSPLRLHFAGQFQANVSTVNNDPGHYDNAKFKDEYQDPSAGRLHPNGWFNPGGDGAWRIRNTAITSAWMPDGGVAPPADPVLRALIADSNTQAPAKLVDLDPEQQMVSEIWGLQVRIADTAGNDLLVGDFIEASFADIWNRATGAGASGDNGACAMYQSQLKNLRWGDVSQSAFLSALQHAARDGLLSIKFNLDGINLSRSSPDFMCGRIVGSIGPASALEPVHLVRGRQFMAINQSGNQGFFIPQGGLNYCAGVFDGPTSTFLLDLGNALSCSAPGGPINDLGDLTLATYTPDGSHSIIATLLASDYTAADWYARTAGVAALPIPAAHFNAAQTLPLIISGPAGGTINISEWASGSFVRPDGFVYRMSPGETQQAAVIATQFGRPLVGATIDFVFDDSQLQPGNYSHPEDGPPPVAIPLSAVQINASAVTDSNGRALLTLQVRDPGNPRGFIDGQVYGVRPGFADPSLTGNQNDGNLISLLLWSGFSTSDPVTWFDLEPTLKQYANLYPIMAKFLDLGNYDDVVKHARLLTLAFALDADNPNSMPVTRDLSPAKRKAILRWLANPIKGTPPPASSAVSAAAPSVATDASAAPQAKRSHAGPGGHGKAAALARRLCVQRTQSVNAA